MESKLSLKFIAYWQLEQDSEVTLPAMQRGFVWKPGQIEALWDSLLRRFPIGSFLFSKTQDGKYLLMDGQQRATAIALGFYNPFGGKMYPWSLKDKPEHLPVVWVDVGVKRRDLPERSKFLLRVVTRSQPWGYDVNHEKLGINKRKDALSLFQKNSDNKEKGYTQFKNTSYFPVAAWCPVPLAFFFEAIDSGKSAKDAVAEAVIALCEKHLPDYLKIGKNGKSQLIEKMKTDWHENLESVAEAALRLVSGVNPARINYDVLDESVLSDSGDTTEAADGNDEEVEAEEPTLFIRVNSGGTTLGGDELIYSIYKAAFPDSKEFVENLGMGYIAPTQVVSIAARIASSDINKGDFPARMTVSQFQGLVKKERFKKKLKSLIGEKEKSDLRQCFETAIGVISLDGVDGFNKADNAQMPPVLLKEFIKKSPDLFLLLVYWLLKNKTEISSDLKLRIAARLFAFSWFTFDRKKRTVEKTVSELWPSAAKSDFWEKSINSLVSGEQQLLALPI